MAVRSKEELTSLVNEIVGENADDKVLSLLEDIADTYSDFETKIESNNSQDNEDWKTKYEENDKMWRDKYKARFMSGSDNNVNQRFTSDGNTIVNEPDIDDEPEDEPTTFEDLFTTSSDSK